MKCKTSGVSTFENPCQKTFGQDENDAIEDGQHTVHEEIA